MPLGGTGAKDARALYAASGSGGSRTRAAKDAQRSKFGVSLHGRGLKAGRCEDVRRHASPGLITYPCVFMPDPASLPVSAAVARTLARHPRPLGGDPLKRLDQPVLSLSDRVLNNQAAGPEQLAPKKKPDWLRARVPGGP